MWARTQMVRPGKVRSVGSILFVSGGAEFARRVFQTEGRGYWSQALPLVLEKHGYLDVDTAGPESLEDPATWEEYAVVLIARLPPEAWTEQALALVGAGPAQALVELPPAAMEQRMGIISSEAPLAGAVSPTQPELRERVAEFSPLLSTRIQEPKRGPVDRRPETNWQERGAPISARQADAWRALGWDVRRWQSDGTSEQLAEWVDTAAGDDRWPAVVRHGNVVACCFSLFAYLGHGTTIAPFEGGEHINWVRPIAVEAMLTAIIDDLHQRAGRVRPRVLPWPMGVGWVLNVRHDFDRDLPRGTLGAVLDRHREAGTSATWYWRARHLIPPGGATASTVGRVGPRLVSRRRGHEVAHHTEQLWVTADREQRTIELASTRPVYGTSSHGDPTCFRWQGAPNVLWAERQGLLYTEFISHSHLHPHRFAALGADGSIDASRVLCLPHHESFDRSMTPGDTAKDGVLRAARSYMQVGGMMQILNHPDINVDELFETVGELPTEGRLDWTAREAASWWRRSHVAEELEVETVDDRSVRVTSARGIRGLVLELAGRGGATTRFVLQLEPGVPVTVSLPVALRFQHGETTVAGRQAWDSQIAPLFERAVKSYYEGRGMDTTSDAVATTSATNTTLVPVRAATIMTLLSGLARRRSLAGARVLDAGSGFGAFATYLAVRERPARVTGIDIRDDLVDASREVLTRIDLQSLDFRLIDMRTLDGLPDDAFDVAIVNNAFIYLHSKQAMAEAAAALARVLAPGGQVIVHHANRWRWREPFTGSPMMGFLGSRSARVVGRVTGWKGNHDRLRLLGPFAMARILRRAGFTNTEIGAINHRAVIRGPRAWRSKFYAVVADAPTVRPSR